DLAAGRRDQRTRGGEGAKGRNLCGDGPLRFERTPGAVWVGDLSDKVREREFLDERRVLIEVAIANPPGPHHEVHDSRPREVSRTIGPCLEVHLLAAFQLLPLKFCSFTFVLHGLLTRPADDERTALPGDEIRIFPGGLDRVEDNLEIRGDGDAHQCRLGRAGFSKRGQHAKLALRDEAMKVCLGHAATSMELSLEHFSLQIVKIRFLILFLYDWLSDLMSAA